MIKRLLAIAVALTLAACASPRNATIEDGKVTNITSAEAVTLVKQDTRRRKVEDVQKNAKPIFRVVGFDNQPITINAKSIEIYVPQDLKVLMEEQPDSVSENVQLAREAVNGVKAATPLGLAGFALADRNNARSSAQAIAETQADVDKAEIAADAAESAAQREALAAANAATLAAQKEAEALRISAAIAAAGATE